jgi:hypothetical protein
MSVFFLLLRAFAKANPTLLFQLYDIPLAVMPKEAAPAVAGVLSCCWNVKAEQLERKLTKQLLFVRAARESKRNELELILTASDEMCAAGKWAGLSLSTDLLAGDPARVMHALLGLMQADEHGMLEGCHIRLSLGPRPRSSVEPRLRKLSAGAMCADVEIVLVAAPQPAGERGAVSPSDGQLLVSPWRPTLRFRRELAKAKRTAQVNTTVEQLCTDFPVVRKLQMARDTHSLHAQLSALERLRVLLTALMAGKSSTQLPAFEVRLGQQQDVQFEHSRAVLYLPMDFDLATVRLQLKQ